MLYVEHGSVFDKSCDLIVLPCDSYGGVTAWVEQEISGNGLPSLENKVPFGKVLFLPAGEEYDKSDFVGFAASVDGDSVTSNEKAIRSILQEVIAFCKSSNCSIVNIPVLGTGAGGLSHVDVMNVYKRLLNKISIEFHVYFPDLNVASLFYEDSAEVATRTMQYTNPRVFISYCRKDKNIEAWSTELATNLRANGVDAIIDKFHLKPGVDLPQWMTNEIIKAQKVLLVCDKHYAERADTRKAGVGWETMIIQGDMLVQGENSSKYIAVACDGFDKNVPIYIKTKLGMSKDEIDSNFKSLLENIFELDVAPELGEIPQWVRSKMQRQGKIS